MNLSAINFRELGEFVLKLVKLVQDTLLGKICAAVVTTGGGVMVAGYLLWGLVLILCALIVAVCWEIYTEMRSANTDGNKRNILAFRHQSFEGATAPLSSKKVRIMHRDLDQTAWFQNGILVSPESALQMQVSEAIAIKASMATNPQLELIYYGKAHIPLVMTLGFQLQGMPVSLCELDRNNGRWLYLKQSVDDRLSITISENIVPSATAAVVRVSVSFNVGETDVNQIIPTPYHDIHISLVNPTIDVINNRGQVDQIAEVFRATLDKLNHLTIVPSQIHIFCAVPMSVAFAMGRRISSSVHSPVTIYNHTRTSTPHYAWGVQMTGSSQPTIIRTTII